MRQSALRPRCASLHPFARLATASSCLWLLAVSIAATPAAAAPAGAVALCDFALSLKLNPIKADVQALDGEFQRQWRAGSPDDQAKSCKRYYMAKEDLRLVKMVSFGQEAGARYLLAPALFQVSSSVNRLSIWVIDVAQKQKLADVTVDLPAAGAAVLREGTRALPGLIEQLRGAIPGASLPASAASATPPALPDASPGTANDVLVCDLATSVKLGALKGGAEALGARLVQAWQQSRPGDRVTTCKRYYLAKDAVRLNRLLAFAKEQGARFVVGPAAYKDKGPPRLSVWLVDVAAGRKVDEVVLDLPDTPAGLRAATDALVERALAPLQTALPGRPAPAALPVPPSARVSDAGPRALLCDLAISVKLNPQQADLKLLEAEMGSIWRQQRPQDTVGTCQRYYMEKSDIRLGKLLSFGKRDGVTHVVAPAAFVDSKGATRLSLWLVDVERRQRSAEVLVELGDDGPSIRDQGPAALVEPLRKLAAAIGGTLAAPAPTPEARPGGARSARGDASPRQSASAGGNDPTGRVAMMPATGEVIAASPSGVTGPNAAGGEDAGVVALPGPALDARVAGAGVAREGRILRTVLVNSAGAMMGAGLTASAAALGLGALAVGLDDFAWNTRLEPAARTQLMGTIGAVGFASNATLITGGVMGVAGVGLLTGTLLWIDE